MRSEAASQSRLTIPAVNRRLAAELAPLRFVPVSRRPLKLVKAINADTDVFFYPGVMRNGAEVVVDPIIGVDNITLSRLLAVDGQPWTIGSSVCIAFLGLLTSWGRFICKQALNWTVPPPGSCGRSSRLGCRSCVNSILWPRRGDFSATSWLIPNGRKFACF